jgi:hypothetical protein
MVAVYFGILIYRQLSPQTREQKILHCLELGSDKRAQACIALLPPQPKQKCNFEISDIKQVIEERQARPEPDATNEGGLFAGLAESLRANQKTYEGTIRNLSGRKERLKALIAKFYTEDGVLALTGYTTVEEDMDNGMSVPFTINVQPSSRSVGDSFENLRKDIYPWFSTCE